MFRWIFSNEETRSVPSRERFVHIPPFGKRNIIDSRVLAGKEFVNSRRVYLSCNSLDVFAFSRKMLEASNFEDPTLSPCIPPGIPANSTRHIICTTPTQSCRIGTSATMHQKSHHNESSRLNCGKLQQLFFATGSESIKIFHPPIFFPLKMNYPLVN